MRFIRISFFKKCYTRLKMKYLDCCTSKSASKESILHTRNKKETSRIQARYLIALSCFLANAVSYMMRVNLSVAIVAMTYDDNGNKPNGPEDVPIYNWDSTTRSTVLSSFFWGYIWLQIPAGYIAHIYGAKIPLLIAMILSTLATFLYVPAASLGWIWACAARVFLGLAQGALLPCCHTLLSSWSVPNERGRMIVYSYTGQQFGTVLAMSLSGLIAASIGWPWIFYVTGIFGCVLSLLWIFLVANKPFEHPLCSIKEQQYIESAIASEFNSEKPIKTPWKAIFTSVPVWALIVVHSVQNWGFWTLLTEIPSYMNGVLGFDLAKNGLLSSLPYLAMWIFGLILSQISDYLLKRNCYSIGTSRKIGNSIAHYGSAIGLIILGFVSSSEPAFAVAILTVSVALSAGTMIGYQVNYIDLSPNFAGTIMGIGNGLSNIMSILGPLVAGFIVTDTSNADQWQIVFLLAAALYIVGNTIFIIFGSGKVQPWNDNNNESHQN